MAMKCTVAIQSAVRLAGYLALTIVLGACSPQASEEDLLDRARLAMGEGDARAAEIDTRTALQADPDNASARQLLGEIYLFQQNPVAAAAELERALQATEGEQARVLYARTLLAAGRGEWLLELDEQGDFAGVRGNPHYLATLARAHAVDGDLQSAGDSIDAALANAPDDPYVATTEAFLLLAYSEGMAEARTILEETVASHPEQVDAWSLLGGIQQVNGELAEAETSYMRAVELNPYRLVDRLNLATVRIDQGKTEVAENQLQRLLSNSPDHPGVNFLHGRMLVTSGDNAEALSAFFKVLNVQPDHPGGLYLAAVANIGEGNLATAQRQLDRLLATQRGHLPGRILLSNLHLLMNDPEAAEEVARDILRDDDMNYTAMALLATALDAQGQNGAENRQILERMAVTRPEAVAPRFALGSVLLQSGDHAGGIAQFQAARDLAPQSGMTRERLIQAHLSGGDIAAARAEAGDFAEQEPLNPAPSLYLARMALQENDIPASREHFGEAEGRLRQAMAVQPDNVNLQKLLIDALMGQDELEEADTLLADLPDAAANGPGVLVARGRIALAGDRPADAEMHLRRAMEERPATPTVVWLSGALQAQGRDEEAIEVFNDWLADNPADFLVRNQLASAYLQLGKEREAREQYRQLVEDAPDNVLVLNNLAWLLREEDPGQALTYIEKANDLAPGDPRIMDTYAMVQLELGATGEALSLNRKALDLVPGNPETLYHRATILHADDQTEQAIRVLEGVVGSADISDRQREEARALLDELQDL
ncbi:MAG: tetratricopeptide repeat protein [Pseudohongiellaceae bacterium]